MEEDYENNANSEDGSQDDDDNVDDGEIDADPDDDDNDNDNNDQDDEDDPDQDQDQDRDQDRERDGSESSAPFASRSKENPTVLLTSPSPRPSLLQPHTVATWMPSPRPAALTAKTYDIVPTIAAPQSTSINAIAATPDMRYVFTGGSDGYIRMYDWIDSVNGKLPLTVAQKHPFVDSVMKAGSLLTYWENEELPSGIRTPPGPQSSAANEPKDTSPAHSLAVHHQALWLLSGLESGAINLQTCRHQAGTRIHTLKDHTSAVSAMSLAPDEVSLLTGSWDKRCLEWDLNVGRVKRSFESATGQISAIERRPLSAVDIPRSFIQDQPESTTFSSNNNIEPFLANGTFANQENGLDDVNDGSLEGSLFGEDMDHGSLFGDNDDNTNTAVRSFDADEDDAAFAKAMGADAMDITPVNGLVENTVPASGADHVEMTSDAARDQDTARQDGYQPNDHQEPSHQLDQIEPKNDSDQLHEHQGGPVQPPDPSFDNADPIQPSSNNTTNETNGLPHTTDAEPSLIPNSTHQPTPPPSSATIYLDAAIDGSLRIWDTRVPKPIVRISPTSSTPPWCMGVTWSPDGETFWAGRRNGTVDEYSIHSPTVPARTFKFPSGSGPVSAVRCMPNGQHLICASYDILRLYDLRHQQTLATDGKRASTVPFLIVPGHRTGVVSALYVDPTCQFILSAAGNRGWEGMSTEVLLGYEIGIQRRAGT